MGFAIKSPSNHHKITYKIPIFSHSMFRCRLLRAAAAGHRHGLGPLRPQRRRAAPRFGSLPRALAEAADAGLPMGKPWGKPWENYGKTMGKLWEYGGKPWKICELWWKSMETWWIMGTCGKVMNHEVKTTWTCWTREQRCGEHDVNIKEKMMRTNETIWTHDI